MVNNVGAYQSSIPKLVYFGVNVCDANLLCKYRLYFVGFLVA